MGGWLQFGRGEVGCGRRRGRRRRNRGREEERVSAKAVYTDVYRRTHRRNIPLVNLSLISLVVATHPCLAVRV